MPKPNDLSRSPVALDQDSTLIAVIEMSQSSWLVAAIVPGLKRVILGKSFKAETNITLGSPAILLQNLLLERGNDVEMWDPYVDVELPRPEFPPGVFLVGTRHPDFVDFEFPEGSVVIDPWRYIPERPGVEVIGVGHGPRS